MNCEYCEKKFKSISSLNNHKKTASYCLELQGKLQEKVSFECVFCKKIFSSSHNLANHVKKCDEKKNDEIRRLREEKNTEIRLLREEKDNEIRLLREENAKLRESLIKAETESKIFSKDHDSLIKLAGKPTKINNDNKHINISNNNYFNEDIYHVKDVIDKNLNLDYVQHGQKGIADFASNHLVNDDNSKLTYYCTDSSRNMFKYKTSNGHIEKDINAKKLTSILTCSGIATKSVEVVDNLHKNGKMSELNYRHMQPKLKEINDLSNDNGIFVSELGGLLAI